MLYKVKATADPVKGPPRTMFVVVENCNSPDKALEIAWAYFQVAKGWNNPTLEYVGTVDDAEGLLAI